MRRSRGFTLVEILAAVAVLSVGLLAAWNGIGAARHGIGAQMARILAHEAALNRAAELRLFGASAARALPAEVTEGPYRYTVTVRTTRGAAQGLVRADIAVAGRLAGARATIFLRE